MNKNNDSILPIGSIIVTKEGSIPLMIVSRATLFEDESGELGYYDYSAVPYPLGITDGKEFIFLTKKI